MTQDWLRYYIILLACWMLLACQNTHTNHSDSSDPNENASLTDTTEIIIYARGNTMYEMAFEPNVVYAKSNTLIKVELINQGTDTMMIHNIIFVQKGKANEIGVKALRAGEARQYIPDHPAVVAASALVQPLDSVQVFFEAPPMGTYPFICSYPGHYLKMRGRLVVE